MDLKTRRVNRIFTNIHVIILQFQIVVSLAGIPGFDRHDFNVVLSMYR